jgi:Protein kinase domain
VGGFAPGMILVDRYRIIGLLGRGGMGEVYRADDLKLGQPVALKFLPRALASDPVRRERFFAEVRITRQLAHPNICRVYDIAEFDGQHFLSMEYIDGEDLASLIKRIGYLPNEKVLDVARQLTAGLAAAHDRGVLHRDVKPANIMIDGHGRVRITDFGLAVAAGDESQAAEIFGTPAYMAPEQFAGKGATVRSDIYALGLVLYEICCGRKAFNVSTIAELREQKESQTPTAPSETRQGIDPIVERLIMRCLERDPRARPASVAQLASALPGGDPLAAALAAGETPSPEMVAAAGLRDGIRPAVAVGMLSFLILACIASVLAGQRGSGFLRLNTTKPPAALIERAQEVIKEAGYTDQPIDSAFGFQYDDDFLNGRAPGLPESFSFSFWYRQSPRPIERPASPFLRDRPVAADSPELHFSGESLVVLDSEGHLRSLRAVPPQVKPAGASSSAPTPDWERLFSRAGLDISKWTPVAPQWNSDTYADTQAAWQGFFSEAPKIPVRIEAAGYNGKPVRFEPVFSWTQADRMESGGLRKGLQVASYIGLITVIAVIAGGLFLARRNLRVGRGDRRGATRLMLVAQGALAVQWFFFEHHVGTLWEVALIFVELGQILSIGGLLWVFYIALEPVVRRRWPQMLVSWTRMLAGEWQDPLVGRDLLGGFCAGASIQVLIFLNAITPSWFGSPQGQPIFLEPVVLTGAGGLIGTLGIAVWASMILVPLFFLLFFVLLRIILRRDWLAITAFVILRTAVTVGIAGSSIWITVPLQTLAGVLYIFTMMRFGLAGLAAMLVTVAVLQQFPITFQSSAWYSSAGYTGLFVIAALSIYAFRISLGGQRILNITTD